MCYLDFDFGERPKTLTDSQLLEVNNGLVQINADISRILDKVTEYAGHVSEIGASDQLKEINTLITDTLSKKDIYVTSVREEVET